MFRSHHVGRVASRAVAVLMLTCACIGSALAVAQQTDFTLARGRVGALNIAMTVDDVTAMFGDARIKRVDLHLEGMPTPALEIRLDRLTAARPSLTAEVLPSLNRIWRVRVFDRRFRTSAGLGVGSTLPDIQAHHHVEVLIGEGNMVAHVSELLMSFDFGSRWYSSTRLPATARVQSVLVALPPGQFPR